MVESASNRSPVSKGSSRQDESWWMDAQLFFPIFLGPMAFLITVFPALESLVHGGGVNLQILFMKALFRLVLFAIMGYGAGSFLRWALMSLEPKVGGKVNVTVKDRPIAKKEVQRTTAISVPVAAEYLEPGMKLAEPVLSSDGKQLIASGILLTKELIELGKLNGIDSWKIEGLKYIGSESTEESKKELESSVE